MLCYELSWVDFQWLVFKIFGCKSEWRLLGIVGLIWGSFPWWLNDVFVEDWVDANLEWKFDCLVGGTIQIWVLLRC
jgi:hypothetical protein